MHHGISKSRKDEHAFFSDAGVIKTTNKGRHMGHHAYGSGSLLWSGLAVTGRSRVGPVPDLMAIFLVSWGVLADVKVTGMRGYTEVYMPELMIMAAPVIDSGEGVVLKTTKSNIIAKTA
jgi:hypothetical protein